jgi:hypothetical protein
MQTPLSSTSPHFPHLSMNPTATAYVPRYQTGLPRRRKGHPRRRTVPLLDFSGAAAGWPPCDPTTRPRAGRSGLPRRRWTGLLCPHHAPPRWQVGAPAPLLDVPAAPPPGAPAPAGRASQAAVISSRRTATSRDCYAPTAHGTSADVLFSPGCQSTCAVVLLPHPLYPSAARLLRAGSTPLAAIAPVPPSFFPTPCIPARPTRLSTPHVSSIAGAPEWSPSWSISSYLPYCVVRDVKKLRLFAQDGQISSTRIFWIVVLFLLLVN